jgi:hypothetical protein
MSASQFAKLADLAARARHRGRNLRTLATELYDQARVLRDAADVLDDLLAVLDSTLQEELAHDGH